MVDACIATGWNGVSGVWGKCRRYRCGCISTLLSDYPCRFNFRINYIWSVDKGERLKIAKSVMLHLYLCLFVA